MIKLSLVVALIFTACSEQKIEQNFNEKELIKEKCASCHNLDMPPSISETELAPPMMAVAFHVKNFVKPSDESQRISSAINFVVDYVRNPSIKKSFCDKDSLKRYGVMPSQKNNISKDELKAVATYIFDYFTQENLSKIQKEQLKYDALPKGEKIALKNRCLGCHKKDIDTVGPSLKHMAKIDKQRIKISIINGSKNRWEKSHGAMMPSFKNIEKDNLDILIKWILNR